MDKRNRTSKKDKIFWDEPTINIPVEPIPEIKEVKEEIVVQPFEEYDVRVAYSVLKIRENPNPQAKEVGFIKDKGVYHILEEQNGFGRIADNQWIMLSYTTRKI